MKNLTYNEFKARLDSLTLVEFWSESCHSCKLAEPFLIVLEEAYKTKCSVSKINVFSEAQVIDIYSIKILPTFVLFRGMIELDRVQGFRNKDIVEKMIRQHI